MANSNPRMVKSYQGDHQGHIKTLRKQKKGAPKDGGGKQRNRRGVFATVRTDDRGVDIKGLWGKHLRVPVPRTRREKYLLGAPPINT